MPAPIIGKSKTAQGLTKVEVDPNTSSIGLDNPSEGDKFPEIVYPNWLYKREAKYLKYERVYAFNTTMRSLNPNRVIQEFGTAELSYSKHTKQSRIAPLLDGFFFIFRLIVLQLVLVSLYGLPRIAVGILILFEGVYLLFIFSNLRGGLFLKNWVMFTKKLFKSITLLIYYLVIMWVTFVTRPGKLIEAPAFIQKIGIIALVLNIVGGLILTIVKLVVSIA